MKWDHECLNRDKEYDPSGTNTVPAGAENIPFDTKISNQFSNIDDISTEEAMKLTFETIEAANSFYRLYSRCVEFSTRKSDNKKTKTADFGNGSTAKRVVDI